MSEYSKKAHVPDIRQQNPNNMSLKDKNRKMLEDQIMDALKSLESEGFFQDAVDSDENPAIPAFKQSGPNQLGIPRKTNSPKINTPPSIHKVDPSTSSLRNKYATDMYDSINILKEFGKTGKWPKR